MIDSTTTKPIRVTKQATGGPYIMAPVDQLDRIRKPLVEHEIRHWVESHAISLRGGPMIAYINRGLTGDAAGVQAILDEAQ